MKTMNLFEIMEAIKNIKEDMLKMIEVIERNEMHIKQLNWKMNNHIGHNPESKLTNKKGDAK